MSNDKVQSIMALVDSIAWCAENKWPYRAQRAAIESAIREAIAAPGWKLMPLEPTKEMMTLADKLVDLDPRWVRQLYWAWIAAAPSPTAEQPERPPNCGSGHCSCIECPYGSIKGGPAE